MKRTLDIIVILTEELSTELPDGTGGLLMGHQHGIDVMRVDSALTLSTRMPLEPATNSRRPYEAEYVLGDDGAYALINGYDTATYPAPTQYWSKAVRFNTGTLAEEEDVPVGLLHTQPQHHRLQFLAVSGVVLSGPSVPALNGVPLAQVWPESRVHTLPSPQLRDPGQSTVVGLNQPEDNEKTKDGRRTPLRMKPPSQLFANRSRCRF
jgi:hypothetical protein